MKLSSKDNPIHHTQKIKARMRQLIEHLRCLVKAFDDYEKKSEAAWRTEPTASRPKERTTHAARR